MRRLRKRNLVWAGLFVAATTVLVVLLVLVGIGYLRLPSTPGPSVTVSEVEWNVAQGQTSQGRGWFGPSQFNYTSASGWQSPTFEAGSQLEVTWALVNYDNVTHTIYSVSVSAPFALSGTLRSLPMIVNIGDEGNLLAIYVSIPSSASGPYSLTITVDALGSG